MPHGSHDLPIVHLHAGELFIGNSPAIVSTVLGSCVALSIYHPGLAMGLICHGIMPICPCEEAPRSSRLAHKECFRYVNCSIRFMLEYLTKYDIPKQQTIFKLFGGAEMFGDLANGRSTVGQLNVEIALATLTRHGVTPQVCNVGGTRGRRLQFLPHTGEVWMKRLNQICEPPPTDFGQTFQSTGPQSMPLNWPAWADAAIK